jgi:hypothetical protein
MVFLSVLVDGLSLQMMVADVFSHAPRLPRCWLKILLLGLGVAESLNHGIEHCSRWCHRCVRKKMVLVSPNTGLALHFLLELCCRVGHFKSCYILDVWIWSCVVGLYITLCRQRSWHPLATRHVGRLQGLSPSEDASLLVVTSWPGSSSVTNHDLNLGLGKKKGGGAFDL